MMAGMPGPMGGPMGGPMMGGGMMPGGPIQTNGWSNG